MQAENIDLRKKVSEGEKRALDREQYEQREIGRSIVVVHKNNPTIKYCPICFETENLRIPLQRVERGRDLLVSHICQHCNKGFELRRKLMPDLSNSVIP